MKTLLSRSILLSTSLMMGISASVMAKDADLNSLIEAAQKEGAVYSVGMPDSWANWKDTWVDLQAKYGVK
ncbi:ABC transporter substrate-binding protein, partial [Vibrio metoecus]